MTIISDERLAKVKAIANIVALRMDMGSTPDAIAEHILSSLEASPTPVSEDIVDQAMKALVSALDEMRSRQAKRDEFLATIIVNIEKNEPTAEFAVNLREYVRNGRAALATKGGQ